MELGYRARQPKVCQLHQALAVQQNIAGLQHTTRSVAVLSMHCKTVALPASCLIDKSEAGMQGSFAHLIRWVIISLTLLEDLLKQVGQVCTSAMICQMADETARS